MGRGRSSNLEFAVRLERAPFSPARGGILGCLRRALIEGSLPPCGGGTGRGVAARSQVARAREQENTGTLSGATATPFAPAKTSLPNPPPPKARSRASSTRYGGREPGWVCLASCANHRDAIVSQRPERSLFPTRLSGFTLIETLAMLAIASVIIVGLTALIHDVAGHFNRGTRGAAEGERLLLAVERLAQDFGSARFVVWSGANGPALAFAAERPSADALARVVFVANPGLMSGPQGDEVVALTIEQSDGATRLVRRRAPWTGSFMRFADVVPADPVVLIDGNVDIAFVFARLAPGALAWSENWVDQAALPRFVRLILRDHASGRDLLGEADFIVRADAPAACGRPDANPTCLSQALSDTRRSP
jgi:hypothetical protein